jgi:Ser/Thr protein kinase RdoA (MazF antagonist)
MRLVERFVGAPARLTVLKDKPGKRWTARATGPRGTAIVKVYATDRAPAVAARVRALAPGPGEPAMPSVLAVDADRHAVILSEVAGRPLRVHALGGDLATCRRAGRVLAAWHRHWALRPPDVMRLHTPEREQAILRRWAERSGDIGQRVLATNPEGLISRGWDMPTVVHRDLYEEQFVVGDRIGLIDLDDAALGPPELDVANLLAHLELLEARHRRDLSRIRCAFLAGYGEVSHHLDPTLHDALRKLTLLRLACIHGLPHLVDIAFEPPYERDAGSGPTDIRDRTADESSLMIEESKIAESPGAR